MGGAKKKLRHPTAMKERPIKGIKAMLRDNRTIRIKYAKAVETRRKPSQKHRAVSTASATSPSRKCTVSGKNLVIELRLNSSTHSLGARQQLLGSNRACR